MHKFFPWLAFLFFLLSALSLPAQEMLIGDENWPDRPSKEVPVRKEGAVLRTPPPALSLPFFDDFSNGDDRPDTNFWNSGLVPTEAPGISLHKGINPPSKGVATFDGADFYGKKYRNVLESGMQDSLASQAIDLSALNPSSNVYLSFWLQAGGIGDSPESSDSFFVWFDSTGSYDYEIVSRIGGDSLSSNSFTFISVPVDQARFFHSNFRFKFGSRGSLNGELDSWHLDYVFMNSGRTATDSIAGDQSVIRTEAPPLGNWTAMPWRQYNSAQNLGDMEISVANRDNSPASRTITAALASPEPTSGQTLNGSISQTASASIPAFSNVTGTASGYSQQTLTGPATFRVEASLSGSDTRSENDSLRQDFPIGDFYALDDGVSDASYGLGSARSFCQRYELSDTTHDTLTAVWLNFAPSLYFNTTTLQSTCLEGKSFRLQIWEEVDGAPNPDTVLYLKVAGMLASYGNNVNEFVRYEVNNVVVPKAFYVGIGQSDEMPIGLGFDKSYDNSNKIWFQNSSFTWTPTTLNGTLMIRPEFANTSISTSISPDRSAPQDFRIYPNPSDGDRFFIQGPSAGISGSINFRVLDLQGRVLESGRVQSGGFPAEINLNGTVSKGLYLVELSGTLTNGQSFRSTEKLMIK